jgi:beta-lactamase regulating signal transducer with metallopeptidase domain
MKARSLWVVVLAGLALFCAVWTVSCPMAGACAQAANHREVWTSPLTAMALLLASPLIAVCLRAAWLLAAAHNDLQRLVSIESPERLHAAVSRTGGQRVACVEGSAPEALCVGVIHPRILVTPRIIERLRDRELDAVLLHEQHHARRRDPLRRAILRAAADVYFYLPVLRWWAERQLAQSELAADRVAIERLGPRAVAGAISRVASGTCPRGAAAFSGAAELRVAQVLGDPIHPEPVSFGLWASSGAGWLLVLSFAWCLSHLIAAL